MSRARRLRALTTPVLGVVAAAALVSACGATPSVSQDKAKVARLQHQVAVDQRRLPSNIAVGVCATCPSDPSGNVVRDGDLTKGQQDAVERLARDEDALQTAKRQLSRDESAAN